MKRRAKTSPMPLKYRRLDVFSERPLAGRPLAVVLDADGLDPAHMRQIACEFGPTETAFLFRARDPVNTARLRIFTPTLEKPFAAAPLLGAAALIAVEHARDVLGRGRLRVALELTSDVIVCEVGRVHGALRAQFFTPRLPEIIKAPLDAARLAPALGLAPPEIGFDAHRPLSVRDGDQTFVFVPVASLAALRRVAPDHAALARALPDSSLTPAALGFYTRETEDPANHVQFRVFVPGQGEVVADAAAFAALAHKFENPEDGEHILCVEQGLALNRPGVIALTLQIEQGALTQIGVGGASVIVGDGQLNL